MIIAERFESNRFLHSSAVRPEKLDRPKKRLDSLDTRAANFLVGVRAGIGHTVNEAGLAVNNAGHRYDKLIASIDHRHPGSGPVVRQLARRGGMLALSSLAFGLIADLSDGALDGNFSTDDHTVHAQGESNFPDCTDSQPAQSDVNNQIWEGMCNEPGIGVRPYYGDGDPNTNPIIQVTPDPIPTELPSIPEVPIVPAVPEIPTLAPFPTLGPLPTFEPFSTFEPLPTYAPMPTIDWQNTAIGRHGDEILLGSAIVVGGILAGGLGLAYILNRREQNYDIEEVGYPVQEVRNFPVQHRYEVPVRQPVRESNQTVRESNQSQERPTGISRTQPALQDSNNLSFVGKNSAGDEIYAGRDGKRYIDGRIVKGPRGLTPEERRRDARQDRSVGGNN